MESDDTSIDVIKDDDTVTTTSTTMTQDNTTTTTSEQTGEDSSEEMEVDVVNNSPNPQPASLTVTSPQQGTEAAASLPSSTQELHLSDSTITTTDDSCQVTAFFGDHDYCSKYVKQEPVSTTTSEDEHVPKVIVESQQNENLFCVCRTSKVDEFMIGCDNCDEWYHGRCIDITKQEAKKIKKFYCQACQAKDPELHTKYKKTKTDTEIEDDESGADDLPKKRSNRRCGECDACLNQVDCGKCDYCKDMRKFGGPNKKRQKCRQRQCLSRSRHLLDANGLPINETYDQVPPRKRPGRPPGHRSEEAKKKHTIKLKHTRHPQGRQLKRIPSQKGRRKKRLGLRDTSGFSSEKSRQSVELPRQCYGPQCQKRARSNSKYCSHECGIQLAVRRIQELLPGRVTEWNETECIANKKAEEKLLQIKKIQEKTHAKLLELDQESLELDKIIEKASHLTAVNEEETDVEQESELDLTIYCITCGIPLVPKGALRHMEKCYMKNESLTSFGSVYKSRGNLFCDFFNHQQGTYCKRLRVLCPEHTKEPKVSPNEVCGCPLTNDQLEETGELCCISKRNCVRHHSWEKLRRAQIDGQRVRHWLKLEEAYEQDRSIRLAMTKRGGVLGLLLHRTIVETDKATVTN